jgi:hypothetical protein
MSEEEERDFSEMSEEEIRELSERFAEEAPEAMSEALGVDLLAKSEVEEFEDEFPQQIEDVFLRFRDALAKESEEERAIALFEAYDEITAEMMMMMNSEEREEYDGGAAFLIEQLESTLEGTREGMEEIGYPEYFDIVDEFAVEVVEKGPLDDVKEILDGIEGHSQQIVLQRMMNPVVMEYYEYIEEHNEITDSDEARQYAEMYYELAELVGKILPRFIAVLQVASGREESYDDLKQMGLNDLIQKLESKKYGRFNDLAEGIDRELRNSIAHRDFKVKPAPNEIEFYDRGELVAELSYSEFQDEIFQILALFSALWTFELMLTYYRIQYLPEAIAELQEEN